MKDIFDILKKENKFDFSETIEFIDVTGEWAKKHYYASDFNDMILISSDAKYDYFLGVRDRLIENYIIRVSKHE